mmetsp:Transcript_10495/g.25321  ORF Transcript_10495/g.25321 Transcript_10495/m.25321 type:complete len:200 (-) Transcript_10495:98-697(-)
MIRKKGGPSEHQPIELIPLDSIRESTSDRNWKSRISEVFAVVCARRRRCLLHGTESRCWNDAQIVFHDTANHIWIAFIVAPLLLLRVLLPLSLPNFCDSRRGLACLAEQQNSRAGLIDPVKRDQEILLAPTSISVALKMREQTLLVIDHPPRRFLVFDFPDPPISFFVSRLRNIWDGVPSGWFVYRQKVIVGVDHCRSK